MFIGCQEPYGRQVALPHIGLRGQSRLADATVVVVGCGALGTVSAKLLTRAGVGHLRLVDDDCVELVSLVGQTLFNEQDARVGQPEVMAAYRPLRRLKSNITVEPAVAHLSAQNAGRLLAGADLVLDGTDNDAAHYLINATCVRRGIPWNYAGVLEDPGLTMNIVPGETPCFACIFGRPGCRCRTVRAKESLAAATHVVASLQVGQALRLLLNDDGYNCGLAYVDACSEANGINDSGQIVGASDTGSGEMHASLAQREDEGSGHAGREG
jgi:adenylyltransferase/sulfurtransferase